MCSNEKLVLIVGGIIILLKTIEHLIKQNNYIICTIIAIIFVAVIVYVKLLRKSKEEFK